jgi:hypothetical protein
VKITYPHLVGQIIRHMPTKLMSKEMIQEQGRELASYFNHIETIALSNSIQSLLVAAKDGCERMIAKKAIYQKNKRAPKAPSKKEQKAAVDYYKQETNQGQVTAKSYVD